MRGWAKMADPQTILSRADIESAVHYLEEYDYDPPVRRVMRFLASLYATAPGPDSEPDRYRPCPAKSMEQLAKEAFDAG
jgi:hypothetical protein